MLNVKKSVILCSELQYSSAVGSVLQVYWDDFQLWKNHIPY